jgi:hypothetical protein
MRPRSRTLASSPYPYNSPVFSPTTWPRATPHRRCRRHWRARPGKRATRRLKRSLPLLPCAGTGPLPGNGSGQRSRTGRRLNVRPALACFGFLNATTWTSVGESEACTTIRTAGIFNLTDRDGRARLSIPLLGSPEYVPAQTAPTVFETLRDMQLICFGRKPTIYKLQLKHPFGAERKGKNGPPAPTFHCFSSDQKKKVGNDSSREYSL